jgi:hypothetical protein
LYFASPVTPEQISPTWLNDAFKSEELDFGRVTDLEVNVFPDGLSLTGRLARIHLRYAAKTTNGPATVIAKFPDPAKLNPIIFSTFQREIAFYRKLGGSVGIRVPTMYYGRTSGESAVILLEDLSPMEPGDSVAGCSADEAMVSVQALAQLHSRWWQSPRLSNSDWMWRPDSGREPEHAASDQDEGWSLAPQEFRDALPAPIATLCSQQLWFAQVIHVNNTKPRTLTHPDFRLDNVFFDRQRTPIEVVVIDWGRVTFAPVGQSLAFLLARESGLTAPEIENCLGLYREEMVRLGVTEYSQEECINDFRLGVLQVLGQSLWQFWSGSSQLANERIIKMRRQGWERVNRVLEDFDCLQVLKS